MLGARIAALRREAGLSQRELADRLDVGASTVGMYEQGRREPSGEKLVALADTFGVSTDYLLTGRPDGVRDARTAERLLTRLEGAGLCTMRGGTATPLTRGELGALLSCLFD